MKLINDDYSISPELALSSALQRTLAMVSPNPTSSAFSEYARHFSDRVLFQACDIGEEFLVNSSLSPYSSEAISSIAGFFSESIEASVALNGLEGRDHGTEVELPGPRHHTLQTIIDRRESSRRFGDEPVALAALADILFAASGITHQIRTQTSNGRSFNVLARGVPSAGALYPIDCYVGALNVLGLERGVYQYEPRSHRLLSIHEGVDAGDMAEAFGTTQFAPGAALFMVFVGNYHKVYEKYGPRSARFLLLETGMTSMAATLASVETGLGCLDFQAYRDQKLHELLCLNHASRYIHPQITQVAGTALFG